MTQGSAVAQGIPGLLNRLRLPLAPAEGWLSVLLVAFMTVTAAWSIDDAGWVLGRSDWTDFLAWTAVLGVVAGFIGSKVGWNRWLAHTLGAVFAALIVPILVGQVLRPGASPGVQYIATATAMVQAWDDLVVNGLLATRQTGHHLLVLGLLVWATGQFAASAVFRHGRPLSAVVVIGALLIGNMAATVRDQLGYLVLFSLVAMFLLIRLHSLDEQATWLRRRIGDPAAVGSIYLRGGTVFILIAVVGSLALTATARSAPLAGAWTDLKPWLLDVGTAIQKFLPNGVDSRSIGGVSFGPNAPIGNLWTAGDEPALTIRRTPGDKENYLWRVVAYDRFDSRGWNWTETEATPRAANDDILAGTLDAVDPNLRKELTFTIGLESGFRSAFVVSPLAPVSIDRDSRLIGLGKDGFFEGLQIDGHAGYVVTVSVPISGNNGLTGNLLAAAGTDYPDEVVARYGQPLPDGTIGPEAQKVLDDILALSPHNDPFDIAQTMQSYLRDPNRFTYTVDVRDVDCGDRSAAECFAFSKRGFCQQYATLMAVLLRQLHIPARYVQGYLPGVLDVRTGVEKISNQSAHAWVEAYFPSYGWVTFDPTGGGLPGQMEPLPSGPPVASNRPSINPSASTGPRDEPDPTGRRSTTGGGTTDTSGGGPGLGGYLVISILLILTVGIIAFLAWRRGPRGPQTPEGVYAGIGRLAGRFGFGPRPTQTAYEYATALGEVLPRVRPELQTVATAKVEVAYGRRALGEDRLRALREAQRRLRVGLLRLAFRRRGRHK
jgi:transglutaminase-like putative cysteine protease